MPVSARILGLDVGEVRIGVAVSDPLGTIALPREVIRRKSPQKDAEAIRQIAHDVQAERIVVGIPLNREGKPGDQARKVLEFAQVLQAVTGIEVITQDERFSTAAAQRALLEADVSRRKRKEVIDKVAAQYILQTYLDRRNRLETSLGP
jgi:putative Holliday junction resolvase